MSEHVQRDFGGQELVIDRDSGVARLHDRGTRSGPQASFGGRRNLGGARALHEMIDGLANVRTGGDTIPCAVCEEKRGGWEIETVPARF